LSLRRTVQRIALAAAASLLALPGSAPAGQPPIRTYTTGDGLAQNHVLRVVRDSRGFLWFCTLDGLSRFDGYLFTNYGMPEGLPHPNVTDLLQARDGTYWVATNGGGVARLDGAAPQGRPLFTVYPVGPNPVTNRVNRLFEDRAGAIWAGTDGELFRLERTGKDEQFRKVDLGMPSGHRWVVVVAFAEDGAGALWIGTSDGVFVRTPEDGRMRRYPIRPGQGYDWVRAVLGDSRGRVWIGHLGTGIHLVEPARGVGLDPGSDRRRFTTADGLADTNVHALFQSADGRIWAGTDQGLSELDGDRWRTLAAADGLGTGPLQSLAEDVGGNLWAATPAGARKLVRNGLVTFREADGLSGAGVRSILEDREGRLHIVSNDVTISVPHEERFRTVRVRVPSDATLVWPQRVVQDGLGEWWIPTAAGLFRFSRAARLEDLARLPPAAVYSAETGLPWTSVLQVHANGAGDVWISMDAGRDTLARLDRTTGRIRVFTEADGVPSYNKPSAFAEDRAGTLWMGMHDGGLLRYRDGRFRHFTSRDGVPAGQVNQLYLGRDGRLWIATNGGGVGRIDDTAADPPRIATLTVEDGLSSNNVACLAEDAWGRVYFGTGHGVDQLDPSGRRMLHHTQADGVSIGGVEVAFTDRQGVVWFGGQRGLSRLVPEPQRPRPPPPVFIGGLRVSGAPLSVPQPGAVHVDGPELAPDQNQVVIEFVGLGFLAGEALRYQFKLEGADEDWSAPGPQRSVNYAGLAPGAYRFLVRAIGVDGTVSATPASVAFSILPPVWRRWWFLTLLGLAMAAALYSVHRYRVARLLEVAAMRTRIATDLHDDIGSNLTKIAILSEVAQQGRSLDGERADDPLASIARISRESVASMSDIVWAINPRRDGLRDLTSRMRRFAEDTFIARGVGFEFRAPDEGRDLKVGADVRRQVYLIFKESVNNVVRHSSCDRAEVDFHLDGREGVLIIADNGRGFDPAQIEDGNGLVSMRRRAEAFGGRLEVDSGSSGTKVTLRIPLAGRS
jgi:signal transduction histidine kinase/ligand-binding sensor domain-containing protein